ncbi:Uma2 family endonuclease [Sphaerospermopsis sp. LEGE 08334]|uniref:Uma2 family endonuclease n=1 Tax=Sphaerospermopsis sp. LEGE 08334 TaxID=1828651 RepID=UPI00187FFCA0|nr:Uma2 family endonuclease [Sphaerospermopsis sp. LEGE 08334]MBE9058953.1 Uma2 family endonuclease [Sphaerospermopsis sp. LEGE 08334]
MVEQVLIKDIDNCDIPDANLLITEDDTPVDNLASAKQQRLLVGSLYSSLENQVFLAEANVGVYHTYGEPAIVPDVFVSFDVQTPQNWWEKQNRCYLVWKFGKVPEVAIEIVSNQEGEELGKKLQIYEKMRVYHYVVYDPHLHLGDKVLTVYNLKARRYVETTDHWLEEIGLGVTLWEGEFEGRNDTWLRWCDHDGNVLMTGDEKALQEKKRAENAEQRAQLLAERLRALGVDPDSMF